MVRITGLARPRPLDYKVKPSPLRVNHGLPFLPQLRGSCSRRHPMTLHRRAILTLFAAAALSGCGGGGSRLPRPGAGAGVAGFPEIPFATWTDDEPEYLLYPGDELDIRTPTAPELNQTQLRVGPDGRITMPLIGQVMAADRSLPELEMDLTAAYASQLVRPVVEVTLRQAGPLNGWVDGEVGQPGVYAMPGDI